MDCKNCGAPLDWDGYRPMTVCPYCRTIQSVDAPDGSVDRVLKLDVPGESNCPRCGWGMTQAAMDGVKVEYCEQCHGTLIQGPAFASLTRQRRAAFHGADSQPAPLDVEQLRIVVDCPFCQQRMEPHPYCGPGNVVIDSCASCGLVWLDAGEIAAIERAPDVR